MPPGRPVSPDPSMQPFGTVYHAARRLPLLAHRRGRRGSWQDLGDAEARAGPAPDPSRLLLLAHHTPTGPIRPIRPIRPMGRPGTPTTSARPCRELIPHSPFSRRASPEFRRGEQGTRREHGVRRAPDRLNPSLTLRSSAEESLSTNRFSVCAQKAPQTAM